MGTALCPKGGRTGPNQPMDRNSPRVKRSPSLPGTEAKSFHDPLGPLDSFEREWRATRSRTSGVFPAYKKGTSAPPDQLADHL